MLLLSASSWSGTAVAASTGTALWTAQPALFDPDIDQRAHRLELLLAEQAEQTAYVDEMDEARVELLVGAQVPELEPVAVVDVCVAPQHLPIDVADLGPKVGGEVAGLAEPVVAAVLTLLLVDGGDVVAECVGWEESLVGDFAGDPFLYVRDVLVGGDADRLLVVVEPGVGCAGLTLLVVVSEDRKTSLTCRPT